MDILSLAILGIAGFFLVMGLIFGLVRGFARSLVRLILVAGSAVGAFMFRVTIGDKLLSLALIDGKTLLEYVHTMLPENFTSLSNLIDPILSILVYIVCFLLAFIVLKIATWIIFCIFNIFIRNKGAKLLGAILGLVQGAAIAAVFAVVLNGLFIYAGKITSIELDGEKILDVSSIGIDFDAYKNGKVSETINKVAAPVWSELVKGKNADGEEVNLDTQIDGIVAAAKLADKVMSATNIDFSAGLTAENVAEVTNLLASLDEIEMTPEVKEQVNSMIADVAGSFDLPIDVSTIDITAVESFATEGAILEDVMKFQDGEEIDISNVVGNLANSTLILPLADGLDIDVASSLGEEKKAEAKAAIENLPEGTDPATIEKLNKLFGLSVAD